LQSYLQLAVAVLIGTIKMKCYWIDRQTNVHSDTRFLLVH